MKRLLYAYRLTYVLFRGEIPKGHQLHHTCGQGWCVNPWHVEPITPREHARHHMAERDPKPRGERCARGHIYSHHYEHGQACQVCITEWKRGRRAWLRSLGHYGTCTSKQCAKSCTMPNPPEPYHHDYGEA